MQHKFRYRKHKGIGMKKCIGLLMVLSQMTFAGNYYDCKYLNVSIVNRTGETCYLTGHDVISGQVAYGTVPEVLLDGMKSENFTMRQKGFFGPSIRLKYRCNYKNISITASQSLCLISAGDIGGDVEYAEQSYANYFAKAGSNWSGLPGSILWTLY